MLKHFLPVFTSLFLATVATHSSAVAAETPPSGIPPNFRLTLRTVLEKSRKTAAAFRAVDASQLSLDANYFQATAPLASRLNFGVRKLDDRFEPSNPFAPNRNASTTYFLGYNQGLHWTGTRLGVELQHSNTSLNFPGTAIAPYYESRVILSARQSLLRGLWYGTDRLRISAGETGRTANELAYRSELDRTTLGAIETYYRAWLGQADVRAAENNLKNKNDLLGVTRIRSRRGTAERPDVLQSESALKASENEHEEAKRILGDVWRGLIISLDLPRELLAVDPMTVPVDLDSPTELARARCTAYANESGHGTESLRKKSADAQATGLEATAASLRAEEGFDIVLNGTYGANGIDGNSRAETGRTVQRRTFPAWSVELAAEIPIGPSAVKGDAQLAATQAVRARALADRERDQEKVLKTNRCLGLETKEQAHRRARDIFNLQSERLRLEESRFRIGRSGLTQVVIASDDRVAAEHVLQRSEVERRLAAWQVLETEGGLFELGTGQPAREATP